MGKQLEKYLKRSADCIVNRQLASGRYRVDHRIVMAENSRKRSASNCRGEVGSNGRDAMRHRGARPLADDESIFWDVDAKKFETAFETLLRLDHFIKLSQPRTPYPMVANLFAHSAVPTGDSAGKTPPSFGIVRRKPLEIAVSVKGTSVEFNGDHQVGDGGITPNDHHVLVLKRRDVEGGVVEVQHAG